MSEMIRLDNIKKIYNPGDVTEMCLFSGFSLSVEKGSFVSVVGSNGSGKTSLLNIICGSIPVDSGRVIVDGTDVTSVPEHERYSRIGRVWQNPATGTCSDLTILENMALADCGLYFLRRLPAISIRRGISSSGRFIIAMASSREREYSLFTFFVNIFLIVSIVTASLIMNPFLTSQNSFQNESTIILIAFYF